MSMVIFHIRQLSLALVQDLSVEPEVTVLHNQNHLNKASCFMKKVNGKLGANK